MKIGLELLAIHIIVFSLCQVRVLQKSDLSVGEKIETGVWSQKINSR